MNFNLGRYMLLALSLGFGSASAQTYIVTDLTTNSTPVTYSYGQVNGVASPYQVGVGGGFYPQALLWQGSSTNVTNLNPSGYTSSYANAISGSATAGQGVTSSGQTNALYWQGPIAGLAVSLNPSSGGNVAYGSGAYGISGTQEVGYAQFSNGSSAYVWNGSAASGVNLNPSAYNNSVANATDGRQQVGFAATANGTSHAMIWSGSATSAQDLHPSGYIQSYATAVTQQTGTTSVAVGYAVSSSPIGGSQAYVWPSNGTTNYPVYINPVGYMSSWAYGVSGTNVVGNGFAGPTGTSGHNALLWRGFSTNTAISLSAFLPTSWTNAVATSIDSAGNIGGYATVNGQTHAILWQPATAPSFTSTAVNTSATVGTYYNFVFKANGLPAPAFSTSNAPPGLTLASSGTFSGAPTSSGTFSGTISATNGISPNASQPFTLAVNPTPVQSYAVMHSFADGSVANDGTLPAPHLVQGSDGNLYGMTPNGGTGSTGTAGVGTGAGIVFRISPGGTYTVVHNFNDGSVANDGINPAGSLIEGTDGNYYGVTGAGGVYGFGTAFRMTPQGAITILHNFGGTGTTPRDGAIPGSSLFLAADGNFYGTTVYGGSSTNAYSGTIFRLSPTGSYTIVHNFRDGSVTNDGQEPAAPLLAGPDGNLYGTTPTGGAYSLGTMYKVTLPGGAYSLVRNFGDGAIGIDPKYPGALVVGADGSFYGTASQTNNAAAEVAYKMTTTGTVSFLREFGDGTVANDGGSSGAVPTAGLLRASDGNYYGTTVWGGLGTTGVAFKMTPTGTVSILHVFNDPRVTNDGKQPYDTLCQGNDGNLYGVTTYGGASNNGTLFRLFLTNGVANPLAITSITPAVATAGTALNLAFTAQGSPAPTFAVTSGSLPPGLTLSSGGNLTGTPTASGTYTFTITASNGAGTPVSQTITLTILDPATDTPVMPPYGLAMLAALLVIAAIFKPRGQGSPA